jgi:hypothetical protein
MATLTRCRRLDSSLSWNAALRYSLCIACVLGSAAACRADEKSAAYARETNEIQADLDAGRMTDARKRLAATEDSQRSFEFHYLMSRVANAAADGTAAPDLIRKIAKPEVETRYGVLNPVTRQLVFICRDGGLRVHDLTSPEAEPSTKTHPQNSTVFSGVFSHDGKRFFSGHQNGDVLVWDAGTWEILQTISLGEEWPVRELAAAPDGIAFVGESKSELQLWSLAGDAPQKVAAVGKRYNFGEGLAFSPPGDMLATGGMFDIILHDAKTGEELHSLRHASYTMGLKFSPDGKKIASAPRGNVNKFLAVFDVTQNEPLFNAGPFGNYVVGLSFSPDGKRIAATGCENVVRLFDAATGDVVLSFNRPGCSAEPAFSHDGRLLGWNEPAGFFFIDLVADADADKKPSEAH